MFFVSEDGESYKISSKMKKKNVPEFKITKVTHSSFSKMKSAAVSKMKSVISGEPSEETKNMYRGEGRKIHAAIQKRSLVLRSNTLSVEDEHVVERAEGAADEALETFENILRFKPNTPDSALLDILRGLEEELEQVSERVVGRLENDLMVNKIIVTERKQKTFLPPHEHKNTELED